jgi:hypothetical protein
MWSTHSRVMWSTHVRVMWSTHVQINRVRVYDPPMPGYGVYPCLGNVAHCVCPGVVHWVSMAVDYDGSWSAGKAGVMPETSFLRLRWR